MSILNKKNLDYFLGLINVDYSIPSFTNISNSLNEEKLIIISGLEGVGKTEIIASFIKSENKIDKTLYFNTDLDIYGKIKEQKDLERMLEFYIKESGEPEIIILEKIQKIDDVDIFIKDLYLSNKYKIILIGNNIKVPGKPDIEILPNYLLTDTSSSLEEKLVYGELVNNNKEINEKKYILELMLNKIMLDDIFYAFDVRNIDLFKSVLAVLASNSDYISLRDFQKFLKRYNVKTSLATTIDYIDYSLSSKIIKKIPKYDIKKGKEISGKNKYIFTDLGIKNSIIRYNLNNYTLTENYIYNILSYLGYEVYGGVNGVFNFNFIAFQDKNKEKVKYLIQITKHNSREEIQSEARKLLKTGLNCPIYLIVENFDNLSMRKNYRGVEILELKSFIKEIS